MYWQPNSSLGSNAGGEKPHATNITRAVWSDRPVFDCQGYYTSNKQEWALIDAKSI
jgi:hypothetical protein